MAFRNMTPTSSYEQPPDGTHAAVCTRLIDIGTQRNEYQGEVSRRRQCIIGWELDEKMTDGRPFYVTGWYTLSLNERAKLRTHLESWRGKPIEDEGFDISKILGAPCILTLGPNSNGRQQVQAVSPLMKGMTPLIPTADPTLFDLDEPDWDVYESLSDRIKDRIAQSPEYAAATRSGATGSGGSTAPDPAVNSPAGDRQPADDDLDDDIPF